MAQKLRPDLPIVFDSRWLGVGGTSRVCKLLLEGLTQLDIKSQVLLWGNRPDEFGDSFPVCSANRGPLDPLSLLSERSLPAASLYVFPHVLRPLRPRNSHVIVLDTIPIRYSTKSRRPIWKKMIKASASRAERILTISDYSRNRIAEDTSVSLDLIQVVSLPVDEKFVGMIKSLRQQKEFRAARDSSAPYMIYYGQFNAHKNLTRLTNAFVLSNYCKSGGRLKVVGGADTDVIGLISTISKTIPSEHRTRIEVSGRLSDLQLAQLIAGADGVLFVSLEEGFGYPPVEAALARIPVLVSDRGWSHESVPIGVSRCEPTDLDSISQAIDGLVLVDEKNLERLGAELEQLRAGITSRNLAEMVFC